MSMEFTPAGNPVADEALAAWREENYSTDLLNGPDSPLEAVLGQVDDLLERAQQGTTDSEDFRTIQYAAEFIEENGPGSTILVSLGITYQRDEKAAQDEHVITIDRSDETAASLYGSRYSILCPDNRPAAMLVQKSVDSLIADIRGDSQYFEEDSDRQLFDATEYDVQELFRELAELQKLASQQTSDDA